MEDSRSGGEKTTCPLNGWHGTRLWSTQWPGRILFAWREQAQLAQTARDGTSIVGRLVDTVRILTL